VAAGLLQALRLRRPGLELRALHETLALATLGALAIHALTLLGDGFLAPSLADLTIPLVSSYQRGWTTLGIVSGWGLALLGLSYYARARIGAARWRTLHRFTALAWLGGLVHALGEGTDAGQPWFLLGVGIVILPTLGLLLLRLAGEPSRPAVTS
jgi:sulfoxide reductase heme-binding subunit YedZ